MIKINSLMICISILYYFYAFYNEVCISYHFFIQIFNIIIVFNATLLYIYVESGEYKNRENILSSQSNNFFIAKMIWQARPLVIYETARSNLSSQSCIRIKGRLKKKNDISRKAAQNSQPRENWLSFFFHDERIARMYMRMTSTCVSAHINIYPRIYRGACTRPPPRPMTRARARALEYGIFFSPPCLESTLQRVYNEGKKKVISLFFFSSSRYTRGRINLYSRRNPVITSYSVNLRRICGK